MPLAVCPRAQVQWQVLLAFLCLPWLLDFGNGLLYYLEVMVLKWLLVGRFREGPRTHALWDEFRRWLLERLVTSPTFEDFCSPFINTV